MLRDLLKPFIPDLVSRKLTNREVAAILKTHETSISRLLKQMKVVKVMSANEERRQGQALSAARREHRLHVANTLSIKAAAQAANCSTRTIYRMKVK